MSGDDEGQGFWTGTNAILTGVVVLLTAGAVLMFVLFRTGVFGDDDSGTSSEAADTSTPSPSPTAPSTDATLGPAAALAGTWSGTATSSDGDFDVVLTVEPACALHKPCGSIHVSSAPCTGRVRLWSVQETTYEFYVDRFSGDSSPDCTDGPGELFEQVDDDQLRYTTDYSDAVGTLQRG